MNIIIDANLLVALVTQHPQRQVAYERFTYWADQNAKLHAPDLAYSEVTNALTRMITAGLFAREQGRAVCEQLAELPIQLILSSLQHRYQADQGVELESVALKVTIV
jgi:predicted nucleic acid-binding protein